MKTHSVVLTPEDLEEFLAREGRDADTKDYEFHAALVLARFHSKQFGGKQRIGFPVRRERIRDLKAEDTFEYLRTVLRECLDEDHPFDVIISSEDDIRNRGSKSARGNPFQLKRFIANPDDEDITDALVLYLNETVRKKYAPSKDATLVLLPERRGHRSFVLDLGKVRDLFCSEGFPFVQVMFVIGTSDKVTIGAIWPHFGRNEYSYENWFDED